MVLRYLAQPRWIPWHIFCAVVFIGCLWAAVWQWSTATAPQPAGTDTAIWRNYAYALNWAVFAVVAVWFWWRVPRDQRREELGEAPKQKPEQRVPEQGRFDLFGDEQ